MERILFLVLSFASLQLSVTCASILPGLLSTRIVLSDDVARLGARQGSSVPQVPPGCQTVCNPINAVLSANGGCPPAQCCNADFFTGYFSCFECAANGTGLTDFSQPQALLDFLFNECASRGVALPKLTFPGQNPDRPLSTVAGGTSTSNGTTASIPTQITITSVPTQTATTGTQITVGPSNTQTTTTPPPTTTPSSGVHTMGLSGVLSMIGTMFMITLLVEKFA